MKKKAKHHHFDNNRSKREQRNRERQNQTEELVPSSPNYFATFQQLYQCEHSPAMDHINKAWIIKRGVSIPQNCQRDYLQPHEILKPWGEVQPSTQVDQEFFLTALTYTNQRTRHPQ